MHAGRVMTLSNVLATRIAAATLARAGFLAAGALMLVAAGSSPAVYVEAPAADAGLTTVQPIGSATVALPSDTAGAAALMADDDDVLARPARLSTLVADMSASDMDLGRQHRCLAEAVYFESRGEPLEGQLAVAQAIVNRVESGRFAETICGVLAQKGQFSFRLGAAPRSGRDWATAEAIAAIAMQDLWQDVAPQAVAFHATRIRPGWRGMTRVATIGRHVFYK